MIEMMMAGLESNNKPKYLTIQNPGNGSTTSKITRYNTFFIYDIDIDETINMGDYFNFLNNYGVGGVSVSRDTDTVAFRTLTRQYRIFNIKTKQTVAEITLPYGSQGVYAGKVAISPDGSRLAILDRHAGGLDRGALHGYNVDTDSITTNVIINKGSPGSYQPVDLSFAPDGQTLLYAEMDRFVLVDTNTWEIIKDVDITFSSSELPGGVARRSINWSDDGSKFMLGYSTFNYPELTEFKTYPINNTYSSYNLQSIGGNLVVDARVQNYFVQTNTIGPLRFYDMSSPDLEPVAESGIFTMCSGFAMARDGSIAVASPYDSRIDPPHSYVRVSFPTRNKFLISEYIDINAFIVTADISYNAGVYFW